MALKGRQEGISTYSEGRFYWKVTKTSGKNALVVAHDSNTTELLFSMTQVYHDELPKEIRQPTRKASAKEFDFSDIKSNFRIQTAGSKQGGRGGTIQYLHCSEVAFWGDAEELFAGLMQSIPSGTDIDGSEIIMESTANGETGRFYEMWKSSEEIIRNGKTPMYLPIFIPWYWMDSYRLPAFEEYELSEEEKEYQRLYELDDAQMLWRRDKMETDFILKPEKFKQEYPATPQEAFESSQDDAFFSRDFVQRARYDKDFKVSSGARVGAVDPGGKGESSDSTAIGHGDNLAIDNLEYLERLDISQIAQKSIEYVNRWDLAVFWIDVIGIGAGVESIMRERGYGHIIRPFIGSASATESYTDPATGNVTMVYENKRAEAHGNLRKWLGTGETVQIPDDQRLYEDILKPREQRHPKKNTIVVESKPDMRKRGVKSPNGLDVLMMIKSEYVPERLNNRAKSGVIDLDENYDPLNHDLYY
tara:strand:+ start:1421 stop:2845 length:1425 start_codon:yes stop_codon:yes gene_type:complete